MDMEKDSALEWVEAFRDFLLGAQSSFAIPVLYEHTNETKFIPFGKVPNDIMFDRITLKYAAIVASAYGMSLGDIGLQTTAASGETLAGSIRQERRTRRTGFARAKKAVKQFMESFLPETLQFNIVDPDDEVNVAQGRARLATATAFKTFRELGLFGEEELRRQALADGIFTINLPENIPEGVEPLLSGGGPFGTSQLGAPQNASSGGQGEIKSFAYSVKKSKNFESHVKNFVNDLTNSVGKKIYAERKDLLEDEFYIVNSRVEQSLFGEDDVLEIGQNLHDVWKDKRWLNIDYPKNFGDELYALAIEYVHEDLKYKYDSGKIDSWRDTYVAALETLEELNWKEVSTKFKSGVSEDLKMFLSQSASYVLKGFLLDEEGVDNDLEINYDNIVENVHKAFYGQFDEYVALCMKNQTEAVLEKIRKEVIKND